MLKAILEKPGQTQFKKMKHYKSYLGISTVFHNIDSKKNYYLRKTEISASIKGSIK